MGVWVKWQPSKATTAWPAARHTIIRHTFGLSFSILISVSWPLSLAFAASQDNIERAQRSCTVFCQQK
jgi:hypothetical protein